MYIPAYWMIIKTKYNNEEYFKIFATWNGGYLDSDTWRLNSGIEYICVQEDSGLKYYQFYGYSGSIYEGNSSNYGTNSHGKRVLDNFIKQVENAQDSSIDFIPLSKDEAEKCIQELMEKK